MANLKAGTLIGGNLIWNAGNMPLRTLDRRLFINNDEVYTTFKKPTPAEVGAVNKAGDTMTGDLTVNASIRSKVSNSYWMSDGTIGTFWRKDGTDLYLMRTADGQTASSGTWSTHRPFAVNLATCKVSIGNGLLVKGGLEVTDPVTLNNVYIKGANNSIIMRDHGNGNVTLSAGLNAEGAPGDLYLGYTAAASGTAGYNTRNILLRAPLQWEAKHNLINSEGKFNSEYFVGPIRTEKSTDNIYHTVIGGTDTLNRGRTIVAAGECGKHIYDNTSAGEETIHIGGDGANGVWVHTGLQSGWGTSGHNKYNFKSGDLYVVDGTKRVFRQGWDFGLGGRQGSAADAIEYTEGKVRDFNKLITAGEFSVSGEWANGINNSATPVGHTATVKVEVRNWGAGPSYVQTITYQGGEHVARAVRYGSGTYPDVTWKKWIRFGPYEVNAEYRVTINRAGPTVYPYMTICKADKRVDLTSGYYTAGALQFKEEPTDQHNPDSGRPLLIVRADTTWDQGLNRGIFQLRKASDNSIASEVVVYEDKVAIIHNGKSNIFQDTGAVLTGSLAIAGNLTSSVFKSANKQLMTATNTDAVYVGNPTVTKLYLETNASGEVYVNANGSAKRVYHEGFKPTIAALGLTGKIIGAPQTLSTEDLDTIKTAGVYAQNSNANTSAERHYPENKAGTLIVTVAAGAQQEYRVYNSSIVYNRGQYSTGAWSAWTRVIRSDEVNFENSGAWNNVVGKIVRVKTDGVMEVGRYIDMHVTNSTADFDVRMEATVNSMKLYNQNGHIEFGPINTSYAHIYTDRPEFYFNKGANFLGTTAVRDGSFVMQTAGRKHILFRDSDTLVDGYIWKDPGSPWVINHGSKATSDLQWSPNGELIVDGARWAASHSHGYAAQPGLLAPVHIAFGGVSGASDYYPMVRGVTAANSYGYTTQVDLGTLRQGNAAWGMAVIRVASNESASHPAAAYMFDITGNFTAPGNVTAYSDRRVKTKIKKIENALDKIDQITGVTYDRTDISTARQMGVIAQDVEKVAPEVITRTPHEHLGEIMGVSYGNLVGLLIEGIKELRGELAELKTQMNK